MEKPYDFRQALLRTHKPNILCKDYKPDPGMLCIDDHFRIVIPENCDEVILTAANDLQDYLFTSLGCSIALCRAENLHTITGKFILVATAEQLGAGIAGKQIPASYEITVTEQGVTVCGIDSRGCAQGCYMLEDRMNSILAPYLVPGSTYHYPAFSPRMTHSGYGLDQYPDAHLSAIAHAGMDAILVFIKGVDLTPTGYLDFNDLIRRAAKYGLDVYAYSKLESAVHPDDVNAFSYYNSTYGNIFKHCPGFKGVVLVGESVEFPSKDPRVSPLRYYNNTVDGLPYGKPTAGWFPCVDYPKWLQMLQRVIYPHNPNADIVLWTYNWGKCEEADRLALIDHLPAGISLMATFEMFQSKEMDGFRSHAVDYTISFPDAGPYFLSEAKRAKERGIRLYTQANSAGMTWDYGVIPYDPFPELWARRYASMLEAREKYGLCGIMETHHYGFWPSFISKIEKCMFTHPFSSGTDTIRAVASELYGTECLEAALSAWHLLSQAHEYYPCGNEDQYGPFRIGPAYPFLLEETVQIPTVPHAIHGGNKITYPNYAYSQAVRNTDSFTLNVGFRHCRLNGELRSLSTMLQLQHTGRMKLEGIAEHLTGIRKADCLQLCNMIRFMEHTVTTVIHAKQWAKYRWEFFTTTEPQALRDWVDSMIVLAKEEIQNAQQTIPIVESDSRLGWEPSMEYIGDAQHIRWKIRQVTQVIENELEHYYDVIAQMEKNNF